MVKLMMVALMLAVLATVGRAADGDAAKGKDWYAAPDGKAANTGAKESPWDLTTAFAGPAAVKPGDTIWLKGGTYNLTKETYSRLKGEEGKPISVRQMPGERAILNLANALRIWGSWTNFYDFEVTNFEPRHTGGYDYPGRPPLDIGGGDGAGGQNVKIINIIEHDTGNTGLWRSAVDAELYGCIIFNNGEYFKDNQAHGHSLYLQNVSGSKYVRDNIMFNAFSRGIAPHGSNGNNGLNIEGNIAFGSGSVSTGPYADLYDWAGKDTKNLRYIGNYTYHPLTGMNGAEVDLHEGQDVTIADNYIAGGSTSIGPSNFAKVTITGNTVVTSGLATVIASPKDTKCDATCDKNKYYLTGADRAFSLNGAMTFDAWKGLGFDVNGEVHKGKPANAIFVRKNKYEEGRANICVYNWESKDSVKVKVEDIGLKTGDKYEVRDVQNWFGKPIVTGTYDGTEIEISMKLTEVQQPYGVEGSFKPAKHTAPEFGVFVIMKAKG